MIFNEEKVQSLVIQWQENKDKDILEDILKEATGLIEVIVSTFDPIYRDDMIQESYIKVMSVLYLYSPSRGKLHSFLTSVIRNECSSYIQHVNRSLNITNEVIESGIIDCHSDLDYTETDNDELLQKLTIRNRTRFPSLPTTIIDTATELIFKSIHDGRIGKSRGTISKIVELFNIDRNKATVMYHSTLVFMRLSMLSNAACGETEFHEFSLMNDFQEIVGNTNCNSISILFSGMYIKFP